MHKKRSLSFWKIFKNRKGFTMTEVVVVLSLLGILTAIAIPSFISWLPRHRLQTSTRQIYDDLNLAKIRAVRANIDSCITFNVGNGNYTVFLDVNGDSTYTNGVDTLIKGPVTLENGVNITAANTCGFNNRGMSTAAGPTQVSLTNPTGVVTNVNVNTVGNITVS
jgi:prepilin-type N-terminal cleavage/methylation domain-containing protein